jgi:RNA polymerase sigma-70 factor (ECF subfamily)
MSSSFGEPSLIERARAGDRLALEELLLTHAGQLSHHIARRLPASLTSVVSVEDILQETLLRAYLEIGKLRDTTPRGFFAWLKSVADLRILDALKAQKRQKRGAGIRRARKDADSPTGSLDELIDRLPGHEATASRLVARREALLALQVGMAGLPEDQREAIRLHILEGKSLDETAAAMGRTSSAVRNLIHRGKHNLAQAMGRASLWLSARS